MEENKTREPIGQTPRKKKKYRRNFVDILILFLIAASVTSFFFRGWLEKTVNRFLADDSATVQFVITDLDEAIASDFGNERSFRYANGEFGLLQDYFSRDSTRKVVRTHSLDGSSIFASVERITDPRKKNVVGTILVEGARKDSGFYLGGNTKIAAGMTFEIFAKEQKYTILVTKIG